MKRLIGFLVLAGLCPVFAAQEGVEKIEILGNERVSRETVLYYLATREGDLYDETTLRRDFRVLWSTGFFSNIRIEAAAGKYGRVVKIIVEENPIVKEIAYKTGKRLKEDDIINKLKEKDEYLLPYSYYSPAKIHKIKRTVEELLEEKGLTGGDVRADLNSAGKNELSVMFRIKEGTRIKVGEILFRGDPRLSKSELSGAMKETKKHGLLSWVAGKDTFMSDRLEKDLVRLKEKLQEKGYMEASVGEPKIEEIVRTTVSLKKLKMKRVVIPVEAGERYFAGDVRVEGSQVIAPAYLRSLVKLKKDQPYSTRVREKAVEKMGEVYRDFGHLFAQVIPVENLDPKGKRVNVTFNIDEGKVAYLNRLEFRGNTYTKDKVLRREIILREGDRFSLALFKNSVLRLRQLGLVDLEGEPEVTPDSAEPAKINVALKVKELQRNNIQFSAGYSGYEGSFVLASYSTVNLLGTGEGLEVMAQYGKRVKNYMFSFTEPYVLDLPLSAGIRVYDRYYYYTGLYSQQSRGVNYDFGFRIRGFWRASLTYAFEYLEIGSAPLQDEKGNIISSSYYYGRAYGFGDYYVGSFSTVVYRSTVDSPLTPSRGSLYLIGCKVSGGPLGGEISLFKPRLEWTRYQPVIKNHVLGLHLSYEFIRAIRGSEVPFWERFYLGGERSIRGYDIYSIGPRNAEGLITGGEKSLVFNAEYIIPVGGPLYAIVFCDVGNAYARDEAVTLRNLHSSSGLEMRVFVPALRVPLRLILSYNAPREDKNASHLAFRFAIGTTF